jgi:integrase
MRLHPVPHPSASDLVRELRAILDRYGDREVRRARPRSELFAAFRAIVACGNVTPRYVEEVMRYLDRLIPANVPLEEVTSVDLALAMSDLGGDRARAEAASVLRRFFAWAAGEGEIERVPQIPEAKRVDIREPRRAFTEDELARLTGERGPIPFERGTLYLMAARTGLRMGRFATMRWCEIDWEKALVRYRTKGRRNKHKPIPSGVLARLRRLHELRKGEERVFSYLPSPRRFRADLALARIEVETAEGRVDRHALRVTFCTRLAERGVNLQTAQRLMDHNDPRLTARIYTRLPSAAERRAAEKGADPRLSKSM